MVMRGIVARSNGRSGSATARVAGPTMRCSVSPITAGMLVQLLLHEMAEIALADRGAGQRGQLDFALHLGAGGIEEAGALSRSTTAQSPSSR